MVAAAFVVNAYRRKYYGGLLVAPAIAVLFVMNIFPLLWSLGLSFYAYQSNQQSIRFVGLANYAAAFGSDTFQSASVRTVVYTVVVVGAEWCPWCQAMHKMLGDPAFGNGYAKSYVLADVGVYNGKQKVASGNRILDRIKSQAHYGKKIEGIPVLGVVNPGNGKAAIIDTEPLELNTKTTKGHDPKKLLAALEKASEELR